MRTRATLLSLALATAALGGVAADEAPEALVCSFPEGTTVLSVGDNATTITAPEGVLGSGGAQNEGSTTIFVGVDLGSEVDAFADTVGDATVTMSWTVPAYDYDLDVNGTSSTGLQPVAPPVETASTAVNHCGFVTIEASAFTAPAAIEDLTLDISVSRTN